MANSMATLSRRLYRSLLSKPKISEFSKPFCTINTNSPTLDSDLDESSNNSDTDSLPDSTAQSTTVKETLTSSGTNDKIRYDPILENGLDIGVYRAILVGQVGQNPIQRKLKSGKSVTLFTLATGGIHNNRRPLESEDPREYANRSTVQWHRISVYPDSLADNVLKNVLPGSLLYVEGNLETKIFSDHVTGIVRRIREVALRRNGRIVFLGKASNDQQANTEGLNRVGYY